MKEKRKFKRLDLNLPVSLQSFNDDNISFGSILNISASGLGILANDNMQAGEKISCKLETPQGKRFSLLGEIRWTKDWPVLATTQYKMGLKLIGAVNSSVDAFSQFYYERLNQALSP